MKKSYNSGEICPCSGQYGIVNYRGRKTGVERTVVRNKRFPPTIKKGNGTY